MSFELDLHGLVRCTQAVHCHKVEVEDAAPAAETSVSATPAADAAGAVDNDTAPAAMDTDTPADAKSIVKKTKKVPRIIRQVSQKCIQFHTLHRKAHGCFKELLNFVYMMILYSFCSCTSSCTCCDQEWHMLHASEVCLPHIEVRLSLQVSKEVGVTQTFHVDLVPETKHRLLEEEGQMAAADSLQRATDEAKNALEEYVYMLRSKVQAECADFVNSDERESLVSQLNAMEDWLYEDGEDEKKSVRSWTASIMC